MTSRPPTSQPWTLVLLLLVPVLLAGCSGFKRWAYEGFGARDRWQQPHRVIGELALRPGDRVADIGAGGGYFTFRLAEAVGREGLVYAVDVDADMTRHLERRARATGRENIRVLLVEGPDPGLPDGSLDLIFLSNTFHHLPDRVPYFRRLARALAPEGRIAILEYRPGEARGGHATAPEQIRSELSAAGYTLSRQPGWPTKQSLMLFGRAADG